jgi:hypothetical protein
LAIPESELGLPCSTHAIEYDNPLEGRGTATFDEFFQARGHGFSFDVIGSLKRRDVIESLDLPTVR